MGEGEGHHFAQSSSGSDISRMYKPVEMTCGLLDLLAHVIVAVEVKDISDKVESVLVVLDVGVEAGKVEAVGEVIFIDFAEVFVTAGGDELHKRRNEVSKWVQVKGKGAKCI